MASSTHLGNITSTTGSVILNDENANLVLDSVEINLNKTGSSGSINNYSNAITNYGTLKALENSTINTNSRYSALINNEPTGRLLKSSGKLNINYQSNSYGIYNVSRKDDFSIMIVDSMCERATSDRALQQREEFLNMAYAVCVDNYYDKEDAMPGIDADEVEHKPEYIPFDAELLQGFELFSSGKSESDGVVKAYRELLTGKVYQAIVQRIKSWFGE